MDNMGEKITVFGMWHLGCITAAGLAELGYKVIGTDFDRKVVEELSRGRPPIFEPGLEELLKKHIEKKNLKFEFDKGVALKDADFIFVTFDTKVDEHDRVDLGDIYRAASEVANHIKSGSIVAVSSQVPVGTCSELEESISKKTESKFGICYLPENLRLGEAINSFLKPDRIVIGTNNIGTLKKVKKLLRPLRCEKITMSIESAEMTKHALNAYMATCISFINEISDICELSGASALDVVKALKTDRRVSPHAPISPGLGFSGGTLARDIQILRSYGDTKGYDSKLLDAIMEVNEKRKHLVFNKLKNLFKDIKSIQVGILGLTYKPGTDTLRRSLSLEIAKELISQGVTVRAYDPKVDTQISELPKLKVCKRIEEAAKGSDVLVLITEWPEFKNLPLQKIKTLMKKPIFIDTKNFLDPAKFKKLNFKYVGVGWGHET